MILVYPEISRICIYIYICRIYINASIYIYVVFITFCNIYDLIWFVSVGCHMVPLQLLFDPRNLETFEESGCVV